MTDISKQFQTPADVADYMVKMLPVSAINILEPTPGEGNILKALSWHNYSNVMAPKDYFLLDPDIRFDAVILNPPFSDKSADLSNCPADLIPKLKGMKTGYHFLFDAMRRADNVIALMCWFAISDSDVRMRTLKAYGLKSITYLPRKTFNYARVQTVIIELEKGYTGPTEFKTFNL